MKKIFYFIASAIVALGAMACQNQFDEEFTPNTQNEGISFTVSFDEATRIAMTQNGKTATFNFEGNETLYLSNGGKVYEFTNSIEAKNTFTCQADGINKAVEGNVEIYSKHPQQTYTTEAHATFNDAARFHYSGNINNVVLSLINSILHCTTGNKPVTITSNHFQGNNVKELELAANAEYWIDLRPATNSKISIAYSVDGVVAKSTTLNGSPHKIFNLGELSPRLLYLVPNINWKVDNARFAAYFFGNGETWVNMTESDVKGTYTVNVPAGYPNVIFCRMNPSAAENKWENKWTQTADLENFTVGDTYYTVGWTDGYWSAGYEAAYNNQKNNIYMTKLYLKPNSNWKTDNARFAAYFFGNGEKWVSMTKVANTDYYEVTVPKGGYTSVIFCRMNPGAAENKWENKWNQTSDLAVAKDMNRAYTVSEGAWDKGNGSWGDIFESTIFNL